MQYASAINVDLALVLKPDRSEFVLSSTFRTKMVLYVHKYLNMFSFGQERTLMNQKFKILLEHSERKNHELFEKTSVECSSPGFMLMKYAHCKNAKGTKLRPLTTFQFYRTILPVRNFS